MAGKGGMDKAKGKIKETAGKATGNDRMAAEGKMDQAKGKAKDALKDTKTKAKGAKDTKGTRGSL
ncbi:CsbD family protein [Streptomyces sp. A1136]|uniref:CsbD family protein n=1 Tax=Streptomyces sp. A1136 TaxID=2563102 RepID=UPI00109E9B69|nr:CsbD family protein [Streptomyces sp. A1136]THA56518.1 CsbD family protein [Streptomyces sp. A1136]